MSSGPTTTSDPIGLHRVLAPAGVLPQAATRLDARPEIWPDEVRIDVQRLNLDAASFRQLWDKHEGDGRAVRREVLSIIAERGKMQNPVTGSGGMLTGTVAEVGPDSTLGVSVGDTVTTLVSLTLTPLVVTDGLARWDGASEQVPCAGHAILFGRSIVAVMPDDVPPRLALAVMDVCGAPALTARVVGQYVDRGRPPTVCVIGGAGKSGSLSLAAAALAGRRSYHRRRTRATGGGPAGRQAARGRGCPRGRARPGRIVAGGNRRGWPRRCHRRVRGRPWL